MPPVQLHDQDASVRLRFLGNDRVIPCLKGQREEKRRRANQVLQADAGHAWRGGDHGFQTAGLVNGLFVIARHHESSVEFVFFYGFIVQHVSARR
jgi:hypothetical protein